MEYTNCVNSHWFWFWPAGFFLFVVVILMMNRILWWPRGRGYRNWSGYAHNDAMAALKTRYAKGEITKAEFDSIRKDIEG